MRLKYAKYHFMTQHRKYMSFYDFTTFVMDFIGVQLSL